MGRWSLDRRKRPANSSWLAAARLSHLVVVTCRLSNAASCALTALCSSSRAPASRPTSVSKIPSWVSTQKKVMDCCRLHSLNFLAACCIGFIMSSWRSIDSWNSPKSAASRSAADLTSTALRSCFATTLMLLAKLRAPLQSVLYTATPPPVATASVAPAATAGGAAVQVTDMTRTVTATQPMAATPLRILPLSVAYFASTSSMLALVWASAAISVSSAA
mmetsp:Transcript_20997/g.59003  ORF Transcript_20997/g.59003 Transcript_20997/m.59003 type:complete len:219 (-) Transcript_20997:366-1022(-)